MGTKLSKMEPIKAENMINIVHVQHHLINFLSRSFFIRNLVSKKRRRMLVGGYDLDMTYITDRVLAMSFPAERMRSMYRNPLWQVKSVLDMRHPGHYKVYNLCVEEAYDSSNFDGRVETYPMDDNHVPPLEIIQQFCESVHSWLSSDPQNIAVVHCMAGKGRTGMMVCSFLVYCGMSADEALHLYATKRTTNNEGVSIPSQRRYVGYWENILSFPKGVDCKPPTVQLPKPCNRELRRIRLYDMVNIESIFFVVAEMQEVEGQRYYPPVVISKDHCRQVTKCSPTPEIPQYYLSVLEREDGAENEKSDIVESRLVEQMDTEHPVLYDKMCLEHHLEKPVKVNGDVRVIFYEKQIGGRLFYTCFNTAFIRNSLIQLSVRDLDKIGKKGKSICGPAFCLELLFASLVLSMQADCSRLCLKIANKSNLSIL